MKRSVADIVRRAKEIEAEPLPVAMGARIRAGIEERLAGGGARATGVRFGRGMWVAPVAVAAAVAALVLMVVRPARDTDSGEAAAAHVVALVDIGEAEMLAPGSAVKTLSKAEVEVTRGAVRFRVAKRAPGSSFAVVAGGLRVEVVGTTFDVTRDPLGVRVYEGTVRVVYGGGARSLTAGERWSEAGEVAGEEKKNATTESPRNTQSAETQRGREGEDIRAGAGDRFERAVEMIEHGNVDGARREYEALARAEATFAETALYFLARLEAKQASNPRDALKHLREMASRFPRGRLARERDLSTIEALFALGRCSEARSMVKRYQAVHGGTAVDDAELKSAARGPCK